MPLRDGATPTGAESDRDARIKPSDIDDARRVANRDSGEQGRRMFAAVENNDGADGPIPDGE
jgi:hypothetical protein